MAIRNHSNRSSVTSPPSLPADHAHSRVRPIQPAATPPSLPALTRADLLARNSILTLFAQALPLLLTIVALPVLVHRLGGPRFGILTIFWTILAYFAVCDFGIGYVTTRLVAERLGTPDGRPASDIFWTCLLLLLLTSTLMTLGYLAAGPRWLAHHILTISDQYRGETQRSLFILGLCLPTYALTSACRGLLEAHQRFTARNLLVLGHAILMLLGPLITTAFSDRLDTICLVLLSGKLFHAISSLLLCVWAVPSLLHDCRPSVAVARHALTLGGWMTVSNIVSPLLQYSDRVIIGSLLSVTVIGHYVIAYELTTKLLIVVGAVTTVLLPAFAATFDHDPHRTARLFHLGLKLALLGVFLPAFSLSAFAEPAVSLWIGPDTGHQIAVVVHFLAVGVLFNALGIVVLSLLLGAGRPDVVAKLHLVELALYLPLLASLVNAFGVLGAALAWNIRIAADALALLWLVRRALRPVTRGPLPELPFLLASALVMAGLALPLPFVPRSAYFLTVCVGLSVGVWYRLFSADERAILRRTVRTNLLRTPD